MRGSLDPSAPVTSPLRFFALVLALSIPFWALGAMTRLQVLPGLSITALMGFCPLVAATILAYRDGNFFGVIALLKRSFEFRLIRAKVWYLPISLLLPGVTALSIGWSYFNGVPLPPRRGEGTISLSRFAGEGRWRGWV